MDQNLIILVTFHKSIAVNLRRSHVESEISFWEIVYVLRILIRFLMFRKKIYRDQIKIKTFYYQKIVRVQLLSAFKTTFKVILVALEPKAKILL